MKDVEMLARNKEISSVPAKRFNRVQIQWKRFLTPIEYMVLDTMLFQSNLTDANDGDGYHFHIRTLAREFNMSPSHLSQTLKPWSFIHKIGTTKAMVITLDYPDFIKWIEGLLHRGNNDCPLTNNDCSPGRTMIVHPGEPIKNKEERKKKEIVLSTPNFASLHLNEPTKDKTDCLSLDTIQVVSSHSTNKEKSGIVGLNTIQGVSDHSSHQSSNVIGLMNNKCIPSSIGASASSQRSGTVPKNIKRIQQEILRVEAEAKEYAKKHGYDVDRYSETAVLKHLGYKQPS